MSEQTKKIPIKKIVTDPNYYPRGAVDQGRILEFVEAMECGEYFPPIKVVKNPKTGFYILLDGKHRLEASILRNETEITVDLFHIPEEHWLMASARFNSKSSKPLTPDETKTIIILTWNGGIKDTEEIAGQMGRSIRYVEMVLKPIRAKERDQRKQAILKLHEMRMNQRDIASELNISLSCVSKTIKQSDNANNEPAVSESEKTDCLFQQEPEAGPTPQPSFVSNAVQMFPKRNDFVLETNSIGCNINDLDTNNDVSEQNSSGQQPMNLPEKFYEENTDPDFSQKSETEIFIQPSIVGNALQMFPKRNDFVLETNLIGSNINELESTPGTVEISVEKIPVSKNLQKFPEANPPVVNNLNETKNTSGDQTSSPHHEAMIPEKPICVASDDDTDGRQDNTPLPQKTLPCPSYLDQIDLYNQLKPNEQHAIRAMELAKKYKMDIADIAEEIKEPVPWIRKVFVAAIALSLMDGDKLRNLSNVETAVGIDFSVGEAIHALLPFNTLLCPVAPEMEQWMKSNLSSIDLNLISILVETEKKDLPYLLIGQKPPRMNKNCFQEFPKSYLEHINTHLSMLKELREHAKNHMFFSHSAKELMIHLNKNIIVINEIVDVFREEHLV